MTLAARAWALALSQASLFIFLYPEEDSRYFSQAPSKIQGPVPHSGQRTGSMGFDTLSKRCVQRGQR